MLYFVCGCGVSDQCVTAIRSFLKSTIDSRKTPKGTRSDDQCECGGVFSACVWFCGIDIAQASIIKSSVDIDETFGSGGGRSVALARNPYKSTDSLWLVVVQKRKNTFVLFFSFLLAVSVGDETVFGARPICHNPPPLNKYHTMDNTYR